MKPHSQDPHTIFERTRSRVAYSLVELLVVTGVVSLLLAFAAPAFVSLGPARKSGIHEVAGFLENARARAVAAREERIIAFADESFPGDGNALRVYALFSPAEVPDDPAVRLTPWKELPKGLVFAQGEHFEVEGGIAFRTCHDLPRNRSFPMPAPDGSDAAPMPMPCLVFGPDGGVREPGFADADALHVGVIEGFVEDGASRVVFTSSRSGGNGAGTFPNGDCLEVGFYTGRARLLTD